MISHNIIEITDSGTRPLLQFHTECKRVHDTQGVCNISRSVFVNVSLCAHMLHTHCKESTILMRLNTFINDEHVQFRNETLTIDCIQWLYGGGDNSSMDANEQLLPQQLMAKLVTDAYNIKIVFI